MNNKLEIGEALFLEGKIDSAERTFKELLKSDPKNPGALNNLGAIYESQEKLRLAENKYCEAVDADKSYMVALTNLANLYQKTGLWEKAAHQFQKCIDIQPRDPSLYNMLAEAFINMGDLSHARQALETSIKLAPDQKEVDVILKDLERAAAFPSEDDKNNTLPKTGFIKPLNILFVQDMPCIRNYKMAMALRSKGHSVSLVYTRAPLSRAYPGLSDDVYDASLKLQSFRQLWDISSEFDVVHCHNEPDTLTVVAMAGHAPVVHDTHDLISLRASGDDQLTFFEGIANRGATGRVYSTDEQLATAFQMYGVRGPSIVINNYVSKSDLPREYKSKLSDQDGKTHIVYEGGIGGNTHRDFLELFTELGRQDINIHIHPNHFNAELSEFFNNYDYIHYHHPVSPKLIMETMTQYDFGIIPFNLKKGNKEFLDTTIANKLFEYLAAGLPVFTSSLKTYEIYFFKNNVGMTFDSADDIVRNIPKLKKTATQTDLSKYVKTYEDEIYRLEELYYDLLGAHSGIKDNVNYSDAHTTTNIISTGKSVSETKQFVNNTQTRSIKAKDSPFYDQLYETGGYLKQYHGHYSKRLDYLMWKKCLVWLSEIRNPDILEVACGSGQFAQMLFENGFTNYTGFDFSTVAIKMAKELNPDFVNRFSVGDAMEADLLDGDYNTVIIFEALEHIEDDLGIINRIKPNTIVLISVPNYPSASHVRWFKSENEVIERYKTMIAFDKIDLINIGSGGNIIYLVKGTIKAE